MAYLSLPGEPVKLFEPGACNAPFEDAIVLFRIDIKGLLIEGGIILDLVNGGLGVALVLGLGFWRMLVVEEETVR